MKNYFENYAISRNQILSVALAVFIALPLPSLAASVALATQPLITSNSSKVKPNLMFILDDSGSMKSAYLPDWANDNHPDSTSAYTGIPELNKNNGFNGVAYSPATAYLKPVNFTATGILNTTTYPDMLAPWTAVKRDGYGKISTATDDLTAAGVAEYYVFEFGEYCSSQRMTSCVPATAPITISSIYYNKPAKLRWCDSAARTNCQSINTTTFKYPRYPGLTAYSTIKLTTTTATATFSQITVNGKLIMSGPAVGSTTEATTATNIAASINACTVAITGNCTIAGYRADSYGGSTVTIYAPASLGAISYTPVPVLTGAPAYTVTAFNGITPVPGTLYHTNIVPGTTSYPYPGSASKAASRTDCAGTTCTYIEEMNNYANWWAYYHTRMQAMKTAVSRSFKDLSNDFRVGFSTIGDHTATNSATFLGNNTFELAHKSTWYSTLLNTGTPNYTPLRGALSKAGRYYARKISGQTQAQDPVQYSCQQNFTVLSTDGYWNRDDESPSSTSATGTCVTNTAPTTNFGAYGFDNKTCVGNLDPVATTARPMKEGTTATSNTLADVAKYYYDKDLRTSTLGNCTGGYSPEFPSPAGNPDVCNNNVFINDADPNLQQHMTTFTLGLGADGTIAYEADYKNATSGDFYDLKNGYGTPTVNWPDPIANDTLERIDDLWHAGVNGNGVYFSAKNPDDIIDALTTTLAALTAKFGTAAAAATSTLNPVPGNNFVYVGSYTTVLWKGNLESRSISTVTGEVSQVANWCAENISSGVCASPATLVTDTSGSSNVLNCVLAGATLATCPAPGVFDSGTGKCTTEMQKACTGTMGSRVTANSDTRIIYTSNSGSTALAPFDSTYLTDTVLYTSAERTTHNSYFDVNVAGHYLNQTLSTAQRNNASGANMINFLRGQNGFEDRTANAVNDRLYRQRDAVLGDALESQPAFISKPVFGYVYPGYSAFHDLPANVNRPATVYIGANDGMMHAFDASVNSDGTNTATSGKERWAYVPSMVIPNMWKLAHDNYSSNHVNYVNGSANTSDICLSTSDCTSVTNAVWRTILVGGLNGGGRGYYALDITDPVTPTLLWEFTTTSGNGSTKDDDLGYSFGNPVVTRRADGLWVVLLTSGYNNTSPGTGRGYLWVLDATTGSVLSKISTGVGTTTTPSGLAKIAVWNDDIGGNKAGYVYGGDLQGNLWRFNINSPSLYASGLTGAANLIAPVYKFATLFSDNSATMAQPITTTPVLGAVASKRVVFIGTGKYLETSDLTNNQQQTQYAIKDDDAISTFVNPRDPAHTGVDLMGVQAFSNNADGSRNVTSNGVSLTSARGWYIDFPDGGTATAAAERANIDAKLYGGVLLFPTIVPSNTVCSPGGWGWLNFVNYETGGALTTGLASLKYDSPIVGVNIIWINGKPILEIGTADGKLEKQDKVPPPPDPAKFQGKRVIWRELIPQ